MKGKFTVLFLLLIFLTHLNSEFAEASPLVTIDRMADEALQLTKAKRYDEVKMILQNIDHILENSTADPFYLTMDERRLLQILHNDVDKLLINEEITHEDLLHKITKFRLVVDAITTEYQPMWTEMENSVLKSFQTVREAVNEGNLQYFHDELNSFLSVYDMIYPSILLDVPVEKVKKVDAQIQYIQQFSSQVLNGRNGVTMMDDLQSDLEDLFANVKEDESDPSLWLVMISTGGIIIATLFYVGWRKYKGEKEKKQQYERDRKD